MRTRGPEPEQRRQAVRESWLRNPKRADHLDISTSADGCVVCRPGQSRLHFLNPTAILILELCTGKNSPQQIAELVKEAYGLAEAPLEDVRSALAHLNSEGLLV